jgi:hypothetical protein
MHAMPTCDAVARGSWWFLFTLLFPAEKIGWRALRPPRVVFVIGRVSCNKFSHFRQKLHNIKQEIR